MSLVQTALEVGEAVFTTLGVAAGLVTVYSWYTYWFGVGGAMAAAEALAWTVVAIALFALVAGIERAEQVV
jgi:hypothetical protein